MSFKNFIYYCALCGGWAGLFCWAIAEFLGPQGISNVYTKTAVIAAILGLLLAGVIGLLDAMLNSAGFTRLIRVLICVGIGVAGSFVCGLVGEGIFQGAGFYFPGWMLVGVIIGVSIGVFDVLRATGAGGRGMPQAIKKIIRGILGGVIGGFIGGFVQDFLLTVKLPGDLFGSADPIELKEKFPKSSVAVGLVILGMCIGLLIGLAQVLLKEAWVRVERGFKAGREMMLMKPETSIGRAEGVDIALFGDMGVEKKHARIVQKKDRYYLVDDNTPGGTFINGERIYGSAPLSNGDLISMGRSEVRFQEKAKR